MERTKEEDECDAVQDEHVGDVRDTGVAEEFHLLFRGAHEEEAGGVQQLRNIVSLILKETEAKDIRREEGIGSCSSPMRLWRWRRVCPSAQRRSQ